MTSSALLDRARRRLHLTFVGLVDGASYLRCMQGWLDAHPEAVGFGWLYDLRRYEGSVRHEDVARFAERYRAAAGEADRGVASVFVTPDPCFHLWARACELVFPNRRFFVAATMEQAERALASAGAA